LPPPYDSQSAAYRYDAVAADVVLRPPGPATALGRAIAAEAATHRPPTPAYAADYVRTAVHTTAQTLTSQSLVLLGRQPASPQSSPHSSVQHWLESTDNMAPPPSPADSTLSSHRSQPPQHALPLGADAATLAPRTASTSRAASRSSRHTRGSASSSIAAEILGFLREMLGHFQAQNEMLRLDAKQREDSIRNKNLNRESLFIRMKTEADLASQKREQELMKMKTVADQTNAEREKVQIEATLTMRRETAEAHQKREQDLMKMKSDADVATQKREQLFMDHELKRMLVKAHSAVQQERLKADMNREIASLEVFERRELEFQQLQEKEREL